MINRVETIPKKRNSYLNQIMKLRLEKCVKRRNVDTVVITQKKSESSQQESNPWPSRCRLDALTTELWGTRGERGHKTRFICDTGLLLLQARSIYHLSRGVYRS